MNTNFQWIRTVESELGYENSEKAHTGNQKLETKGARSNKCHLFFLQSRVFHLYFSPSICTPGLSAMLLQRPLLCIISSKYAKGVNSYLLVHPRFKL